MQQDFNPLTGPNDLEGCPGTFTPYGSFNFTWDNYVTVSSNYSNAEYTSLKVSNGAQTGGYAWYGMTYVYQDKSQGITDATNDFVCYPVQGTDKSVTTDWSLGFGSTDITAEQYVHTTSSDLCGAQDTLEVLFTIAEP